MVMNRNGKSLPLMMGPPPFTNLRESGKADVRMHQQDSHHQRGDGSQFHVGGEIIARRQQQPYRQHRGDEAVSCHQQRDLVRRESQRAGGARLREPVAADHRRHQQHHAEDAGTGDT